MPKSLGSHLLSALLFTCLICSNEARANLAGDINGDCSVDRIDLDSFCLQWLDDSECSGPGCADLTGDAFVNAFDFVILASNWGRQISPLVINEFMASNASTPADPDGDFPDWIEIYNVSSQPVNLQDWYLTDDAGNLNKWNFPTMELGAYGYLVVFASGEDQRDPCLPIHTNFKLSGSGEYLAIVQPNGTVAHEYAPQYPQQLADVSYGLAVGLGETPVYFTAPSPGAENTLGVAELGPIIREVEHNPLLPRDSNNIVVTANISAAFAPVNSSSVKLYYRVMFGAEPNVRMYDDGMHGDGNATDGVYGATIPASASGPNDMVRWRITAKDTNNVTSNWPLYPNPNNSPKYLGTIISVPTITSAMPILHWYVENPAEADKNPEDDYNPPGPGTRCSVFYNGTFYDNVLVRSRGATTTRLVKKSHKFVFNRGHYFEYDPDKPSDEEINVNAVYADSSYMRDILSMEHIAKTGCPASTVFPVHVRQNGQFWGLGVFVEQVDDRYLERYGLDPDGSLYKAWMNGTYFDNPTEFALKNGSDYSDMTALCNGLALAGWAKTKYILDNINIPEVIDAYAICAIISEMDHSHKNYYVHFNRLREEWYIFHWDVDLTWGYEWGITNIVTNQSIFYGDSNYLIGGLFGNPMTRQMYLRRLRTLMDEVLEPSSVPLANRKVENRINQLHDIMKPEADKDRAKWGFTSDPWFNNFPQLYFDAAVAQIKNDYLPPRRTFLFVTNSVGNGGEIPNSQPLHPAININNIEFNPSSHNQDQEYIELYNPNSYAVDVSGWELTDAIEFTLPAGTVIPDGCSVYVSPDVKAFRNRTTSPKANEGRFVVGNYSGHLSSWPETINLLDDDGNLVDSVTYAGNPSDQQRYLRITEMMYHPADPNAGSLYNDDAFEYIELKNIGTSNLNLNDVKFTNGIDYEFPGTSDVNLIGRDYVWKYEQSGSNLGTAWRASSYNDSSWPAGAGILYDEDASSWPPVPWIKNTVLNAVNGKITFYFRRHFNLPANPATDTITLKLTTLIDDGAVFYINGVEVKRLGMPTGTISYNTLANRAVNNAVTEGPFVVPSTSLVAGDNVLAVEVHQYSSTGPNASDMAFGVMLDATITKPSIILGPDEYVLVVKDINAFAERYPSVTEVNILGPYEGQLSNGGETVKLEDFTNSTILEFGYEDNWYPITDGAGFSLVTANEDDPNLESWDEKEGWRPSAVYNGSPGEEDPAPVANPGDVVINEVLAHSHGSESDWIELHNTTGAVVNIGGWFLSDDDNDFTKYEIAASTVIGANGYIVFYEDVDFGFGSGDPGCHVPFALSENGDTVYLSSGAGGQLGGGFSEDEDFGASETGVSLGRYQTSTGDWDFVAMDHNTPGTANAYPKVGPVVINEIMYNPQSGNQNEEYIELHNISGSVVYLYNFAENTGWKFTDGVDFTFGSDANIPAYGYMMVVKNVAAFTSAYGAMPPTVRVVGPYNGQLDNGGERVQISKPGDVDEGGVRQHIRVDRVNYDDEAPWPTGADGGGMSLTRINPNLYGNDVINWGANSPSPGN